MKHLAFITYTTFRIWNCKIFSFEESINQEREFPHHLCSTFEFQATCLHLVFSVLVNLLWKLQLICGLSHDKKEMDLVSRIQIPRSALHGTMYLREFLLLSFRQFSFHFYWNVVRVNVSLDICFTQPLKLNQPWCQLSLQFQVNIYLKKNDGLIE